MRIFRFESIDSTSDYLKNKKDIENYDLAIAEIQTKGRGRRGNRVLAAHLPQYRQRFQVALGEVDRCVQQQ